MAITTKAVSSVENIILPPIIHNAGTKYEPMTMAGVNTKNTTVKMICSTVRSVEVRDVPNAIFLNAKRSVLDIFTPPYLRDRRYCGLISRLRCR